MFAGKQQRSLSPPTSCRLHLGCTCLQSGSVMTISSNTSRGQRITATAQVSYYSSYNSFDDLLHVTIFMHIIINRLGGVHQPRMCCCKHVLSQCNYCSVSQHTRSFTYNTRDLICCLYNMTYFPVRNEQTSKMTRPFVP